MKSYFTFSKFPERLILLLFFLFSIGAASNLFAEEQFSKDLILGDWKLVSIYYDDAFGTRNFDENLKNGIAFTENQVSEIIHKNKNEKPYKMTHSYSIEGKCVMVLQPSGNVCWEVKSLTKTKLLLITPIGEYSLVKQ